MEENTYYRNKEAIKGVEEQTLWKLIYIEDVAHLILVNDDEDTYVPYATHKDKFVEVELPY